jgi:malate dehydrogenase
MSLPFTLHSSPFTFHLFLIFWLLTSRYYILSLPLTWQPFTEVGSSMLEKVVVVGAGNVGATAAQRLAEKSLARQVVMVDVIEGVPQGKALDQWQSGPIEGFDARVRGTQTYDDAAGADVFVVTAGIARKPGMSRDDLVKTNAGIVRSVSEQIARAAPQAIVVVVSNPLDVMCYVVKKTTGFPRERVIGMAGVLDSARMRAFIAKELNVSVENVHAFVLGGHGDTMVPLPRYSTVAGIPITDLMDKATIDRISARTAGGGLEITQLVGTSAWYAPGASVVEMIAAILLDKKKILPCSVYLQGEYGVRDLFVGVPCKLGLRGLEQIIQIKLTPDEDAAFKKSAAAVKELVGVIGV